MTTPIPPSDATGGHAHPTVWRINHPGTLEPTDCESFENAMRLYEGFNPPRLVTNGAEEDFAVSCRRMREYHAGKWKPATTPPAGKEANFVQCVCHACKKPIDLQTAPMIDGVYFCSSDCAAKTINAVPTPAARIVDGGGAGRLAEDNRVLLRSIRAHLAKEELRTLELVMQQQQGSSKEQDARWAVLVKECEAQKRPGALLDFGRLKFDDVPSCIDLAAPVPVVATTGTAEHPDTVRLNKLDALLREDPFRLIIKWDNYQDSGVYIHDGLNKEVAHSEIQSTEEDPEDSQGRTLRAAIDKLPSP